MWSVGCDESCSPKHLKHPSSLPVSCGIHSFQLENEILLFSEQTRQLVRLNNSAAFIWRCYEEGLAQQDIIEALSQTFDLSRESVEKDVDSVLSEWLEQGFLGITSPPEPEPYEASGDTTRPDFPEPLSRACEYPFEQNYQLPGTIFRFRFTSARLMAIAKSVLGHLEITPESLHTNVAIDVQQDAKGFFLFRNNEIADYCKSENELGPLLHGQVLSNTYSRTACLLAIHAGAVSNGQECLVLPALSGNGKSTLTAALIASGYHYGTDELVLLQPQTYRIQAIAMALGIKTGSWNVLQAFHPDIKNLPMYQRTDGQKVRYLLPEKALFSYGATQLQSVRALVFPTYLTDIKEPHLSRLTPAEALCRLTEAGTDMKGGLDVSRVTDIVHWISKINAYELHYSNLEDAVAHIRVLLP